MVRTELTTSDGSCGISGTMVLRRNAFHRGTSRGPLAGTQGMDFGPSPGHIPEATMDGPREEGTSLDQGRGMMPGAQWMAQGRGHIQGWPREGAGSLAQGFGAHAWAINGWGHIPAAHNAMARRGHGGHIRMAQGRGSIPGPGKGHNAWASQWMASGKRQGSLAQGTGSIPGPQWMAQGRDTWGTSLVTHFATHFGPPFFHTRVSLRNAISGKAYHWIYCH